MPFHHSTSRPKLSHTGGWREDSQFALLNRIRPHCPKTLYSPTCFLKPEQNPDRSRRSWQRRRSLRRLWVWRWSRMRPRRRGRRSRWRKWYKRRKRRCLRRRTRRKRRIRGRKAAAGRTQTRPRSAVAGAGKSRRSAVAGAGRSLRSAENGGDRGRMKSSRRLTAVNSWRERRPRRGEKLGWRRAKGCCARCARRTGAGEYGRTRAGERSARSGGTMTGAQKGGRRGVQTGGRRCAQKCGMAGAQLTRLGGRAVPRGALRMMLGLAYIFCISEIDIPGSGFRVVFFGVGGLYAS